MGDRGGLAAAFRKRAHADRRRRHRRGLRHRWSTAVEGEAGVVRISCNLPAPIDSCSEGTSGTMHSRRWRGAKLGLVALAVGPTAGCLLHFNDLDVSLPGRLQPNLLEVAASTSATPVFLAVDRLGNLTLNGHVLDLPGAAEHRRFGLVAVDATLLPPPWRPPHAPTGGVLVTSLAKASPLAIAGLRPYDLVASVDGATVAAPGELVAALVGVADRARVRLAIVRPDGSVATVDAQAGGPVEELERLRTPFLFERSTSATGSAFGLGPLDQLVWWYDRVEHAYADVATGDPSRFVRRWSWGFLGALIGYERRVDLHTGAAESWVVVLGIKLGGPEDEP